jgi:hypothetical protein
LLFDPQTPLLTHRVYHGLPETRSVSETGHVGMGTVVHFGTPQHTAYPYRGVAGMHGYYYKVSFIYLFIFSPLIIISLI